MILSAQDARGLTARSNLCSEFYYFLLLSITLFSLKVFCSSQTENEATPLRSNLIHFCLPKRHLSKPVAKAKSPRHFGLADAADFGSTMQGDIPRSRTKGESGTHP